MREDPQPKTLYWEDFQPQQCFQTPEHLLSREDILAFAKAYDPQPYHLDAEQAEASIFGGLCASGWQVCALMMRLLVDTCQREGIAYRGTPGVDRLRWFIPVFVNDRLSARITVVALNPHSDKQGEVLCQIEVYNQQETRVIALTTPIYVACREVGGEQ